jgi:hypothetical protein
MLDNREDKSSGINVAVPARLDNNENHNNLTIGFYQEAILSKSVPLIFFSHLTAFPAPVASWV